MLRAANRSDDLHIERPPRSLATRIQRERGTGAVAARNGTGGRKAATRTRRQPRAGESHGLTESATERTHTDAGLYRLSVFHRHTAGGSCYRKVDSCSA